MSDALTAIEALIRVEEAEIARLRIDLDSTGRPLPPAQELSRVLDMQRATARYAALVGAWRAVAGRDWPESLADTTPLSFEVIELSDDTDYFYRSFHRPSCTHTHGQRGSGEVTWRELHEDGSNRCGVCKPDLPQEIVDWQAGRFRPPAVPEIDEAAVPEIMKPYRDTLYRLMV